MDNSFRAVEIVTADKREGGRAYWSDLETRCEDYEREAVTYQDLDNNHNLQPPEDPIPGLRWKGVFAVYLREVFKLRPSLVVHVVDAPLLPALRDLQQARELISLA